MRVQQPGGWLHKHMAHTGQRAASHHVLAVAVRFIWNWELHESAFRASRRGEIEGQSRVGAKLAHAPHNKAVGRPGRIDREKFAQERDNCMGPQPHCAIALSLLALVLLAQAAASNRFQLPLKQPPLLTHSASTQTLLPASPSSLPTYVQPAALSTGCHSLVVLSTVTTASPLAGYWVL